MNPAGRAAGACKAADHLPACCCGGHGWVARGGVGCRLPLRFGADSPLATVITEFQVVGVPQVGGRVISVRGPGQVLFTDKVGAWAACAAWAACTAGSAWAGAAVVHTPPLPPPQQRLFVFLPGDYEARQAYFFSAWAITSQGLKGPESQPPYSFTTPARCEDHC